MGWRKILENRFLMIVFLQLILVLITNATSVNLASCDQKSAQSIQVSTVVALSALTFANFTHVICLFLRSGAGIISYKVEKIIKWLIVLIAVLDVGFFVVVLIDVGNMSHIGNTCFGYTSTSGLLGLVIAVIMSVIDLIYGYYFWMYTREMPFELFSQTSRVMEAVAREGIKTIFASLVATAIVGVMQLLDKLGYDVSALFMAFFKISQCAIVSLWVSLKLKIDTISKNKQQNTVDLKTEDLDKWRTCKPSETKASNCVSISAQQNDDQEYSSSVTQSSVNTI